MKEKNNVIYKVKRNIAIITLSKPRIYNAFDDFLIKELIKIIESIEKNKEIRLIKINAEGKHFSAGADLNWMKKMARFSFAENEADAKLLAVLLNKLSQLPHPVIAITQGKTFGGGIGLLACADIVIALTESQFCFSEVKLGMIPATIAPYIIRKIGFSATQRYFLSAESIDAVTAKHLGLVHIVSEPENLEKNVMQITNNLLANAPQALTATKELTQKLVPINNEIMDFTAKLLAKVRCGDEAQEGLSAFLNKSKPSWQVNK